MGAAWGQEDITALQAVIQVAIAPFMARLEALEKVTMPPLQQQLPAQGRDPPLASAAPGQTEDPTPRHWPPPSAARMAAPATPGKVGTSTVTVGQNNNAGAEGQEFQMVRWHRRKGGTQQAGTMDPSHTQPTMINLTPASYADAAAAATDLPQTRANPKPTYTLLKITEVMVLCQGGHINSLTEQQI